MRSAMDIGEVLRRVDYGTCKCRPTGTYGSQRAYTVSERRTFEAAQHYDARMVRPKDMFIRPRVKNHVRGLIDDRETLESVREALGGKTVYDIVQANRLYEPARTHALQAVINDLAPHVIS